MSVANAGPAATAVYPETFDTDEKAAKDPVTATVAQEEQPLAPDTHDPAFEADRREIWAYYSYYVGNNGLSLFNFAPTSFQNLLYQSADANGFLMFWGANRTINSIVLVTNGVSFAIQCVLFLLLGSLADFGRWRPYILVFWSLVAFGVGFGWLAVHVPSKWESGVGLYMIGLIAYQLCITYWTAAAPQLARNTRQMREAAESFEARSISREDYDFKDMMERNRIFNMAFVVQSAGEIVILAVLVGILFACHVNDSVAQNNYGLSVLIAYTTGCWVLLSLPWFFFEKKRPGKDLPPGMNLVSVMFHTLYHAGIAIWQLKQSLLYLFGFFVMSDSLNTTVTVIATLQNSVVAFNSLTLTYLLIAGIAAQFVGIYAFWLVQKRYGLSTKTMFNAVMFGIIVLDGWGFIGIFTQKFGFHHEWEFWAYQVVYGLLVCPWYSYSQTMISEVTPRGKEFLFFSLFSIMGKTSGFIGPIVSSAIIDASPNGNNSLPFYFLLGLSVLAFVVLAFGVDLKKARIEQTAFLEREARQIESRQKKLGL